MIDCKLTVDQLWSIIDQCKSSLDHCRSIADPERSDAYYHWFIVDPYKSIIKEEKLYNKILISLNLSTDPCISIINKF